MHQYFSKHCNKRGRWCSIRWTTLIVTKIEKTNIHFTFKGMGRLSGTCCGMATLQMEAPILYICWQMWKTSTSRWSAFHLCISPIWYLWLNWSFFFSLSRMQSDGGEQRHFPPSFRIHRSYSTGPAGSAGQTGREGSKSKFRKSRIIHHLKRGTSAVKSVIPKIKDVNVIDKYSRLIFPVSFLLFNVAYWCFYVFEV